jgi:serine carboxypeptidase-like clade 1
VHEQPLRYKWGTHISCPQAWHFYHISNNTATEWLTNLMVYFSKCLKGICPNHVLEPLCTFASPHAHKLDTTPKLSSGPREMLQLQEYTADAELKLSEISLQCRVSDQMCSPFFFLVLLGAFFLMCKCKRSYLTSQKLSHHSWQTAGYIMSSTWANNASVREALGIHKVWQLKVISN